jgi:hypothetical protein
MYHNAWTDTAHIPWIMNSSSLQNILYLIYRKETLIYLYWLPGNNHDCQFLKKCLSQKLTKELLYYQPCVQGFPPTRTHMHRSTEKNTQKHTPAHTHMHRSIQTSTLTHTHTHTHTHTYILIHCSLNLKHSRVSEFVDLHVINVPFSSSNP